MRIHGVCSYLGTNYYGWQKQINENSIQSEIEKVLTKVLNSETNIFGSGRTDAGVHALRQHFHFEVKKEVDLSKLIYSLNSLLPTDIKIISLEEVSEDFHARFSATKKEYIYKISKSAKDPFKKDLYWLNPRPFDVEKFKEALNLFVGEHNYQDFTSKEEDEQNYVRRIDSIFVKEVENDYEIEFIGNGFMRYQIRFMVGTAMSVANGEIDINYIKTHLDSNKEREISHYKAPSNGLYLAEVFYK